MGQLVDVFNVHSTVGLMFFESDSLVTRGGVGKMLFCGAVFLSNGRSILYLES